MYISKTPFRLPLAGGGTDIEFYYKQKKGLLISAAFNQYIYTYISERKLSTQSIIQTSDLQIVSTNKKIRHRIINKTLNFFNIKKKVHIGFFSTLPTRSGIGSSSSLIVGLIEAISLMLKKKIPKEKVIEYAIYIERKILREAGGIQDQIVACMGGINKIAISRNGNYKIIRLNIKKEVLNKIEKKLLLVFSRKVRFSTDIIKSQKKNIKSTISRYDKIKKLVPNLEDSFKKGNHLKIGELFHQHWEIKKGISNKITSKYLDNIYLRLKKSKNFIGGKIIGAGGGGFFLMVVNDKTKAEKYLKLNKLEYVYVSFDFNGSIKRKF